MTSRRRHALFYRVAGVGPGGKALGLGLAMIAMSLGSPRLVVAQTPVVTRVSVATGNVEANGSSAKPAISSDGRWVAFESGASNLAPGDTSFYSDVFVHDRQTGTTTRVSDAPGGNTAIGDSQNAAISANGRWVAFDSYSGDLVPGDTNSAYDVFVHDRQTGTTTRVSVGPGGAQTTGNGFSESFPSISADGRWVAFASRAINLVPNDTNTFSDVFVHDQQTGATTRVSAGPGGSQANNASISAAISADGRWVAFESLASNLVSGDTNGTNDVFVYDRHTGVTTLESVGVPNLLYGARHPSISADGRFVAFESNAPLVTGDTNFQTDVFVRDRLTGAISRVSVSSTGLQGNDESNKPAISADGRWVAFESRSTSLIANKTRRSYDIFVHDRQTGVTKRVSEGPGGLEANGNGVTDAAISADGHLVSFVTDANNLIVGDTNNRDVFVHDSGDTTCTVALAPSAGAVPAVGATGSVMVLGAATCGWTAVSNDTSWLTVAGGSSGSGFGIVSYGAAANVGAPRTSSLAIGDRTFLVDQAGLFAGPAPTTFPDVYATPFATTLVVGAPGVLANDANNGNGALSAMPVGSPSNGTLSLNASGAFVYSPNAGFSGADSFSYRAVNNGGPGNVATVTIAVAGPTTPLPPSDLVTRSVRGNTVELRWLTPTRGPAPTGFVLEGGVAPGQVLASIPTGSLSPTFTFTAPSGSFYVRVHALNGAFKSVASNEVLVHVNVPVAPSAPANLLGLVNGSTLALAWTNTYAGGAPTSVTLNVSGAVSASLPLGLTDGFSFAGVPSGTYTLSVVATNAGGVSAPSNPVTLTFPSACSGPPQPVTNFLAYQLGGTLFLNWDAPAAGAAPSGYVLDVTGSYVGSIRLLQRALSAPVPSGAYTFSVVATNPCGSSVGTLPQTVTVP